MKMPTINQVKNVTLAAFIFGSLGAYIGIQAMNTIDARQDDRINAVLHAASVKTAPVPAVAPVPAAPVPTATPGK